MQNLDADLSRAGDEPGGELVMAGIPYLFLMPIFTRELPDVPAAAPGYCPGGR